MFPEETSRVLLQSKMGSISGFIRILYPYGQQNVLIYIRQLETLSVHLFFKSKEEMETNRHSYSIFLSVGGIRIIAASLQGNTSMLGPSVIQKGLRKRWLLSCSLSSSVHFSGSLELKAGPSCMFTSTFCLFSTFRCSLRATAKQGLFGPCLGVGGWGVHIPFYHLIKPR